MVTLKAGNALYNQTLKSTNINKSEEKNTIESSRKINRVEEIKSQMEKGEYKIDINETAKAMAEYLAGG